MPLALLMSYAASAADEAPASAATLGVYSACAECAVSLGMDPQYAPIAAIVTAVLLRPLEDAAYAQAKARIAAMRAVPAVEAPKPPESGK
jgi:hypothetical protein